MNRFGVLNLLIAIGLVAVVSAIDCNSPPERVDPKTCCPHEDLVSTELAEQCKSFLESSDESSPPPPPPGPGRKGRGRHHNPCYMECIVNATGILNGDDLDEAKLKTYLSSVYSESPDFIPVVEKAFETCVEKRKEFREMMAKNPPPPPPPGMPKDGKMCKPCSAMLMFCVEGETLLNCPESAWKNDDACNNSRDFFKNCKRPHPPHPHHHGGPPPK